MWPSRAMDALGSRQVFIRRILFHCAHLEHGGAFADTHDALRGRRGQARLKFRSTNWSAMRRAHLALPSPPTNRSSMSRCEGSEIVIVIDVHASFELRTHARRLFARGSCRQRKLCDHAHRRRTRSARVAFTRDGSKLLVANRLDDTISVIDARTNRVHRPFNSKGQQISALFVTESRPFIPRVTPSRDKSAAPTATSTPPSMAYVGSGAGRLRPRHRRQPPPSKTCMDTEPYKWNGGNPNMPTECGPRTEKYFWRSENYDDLTLTDLVVYIRSLPRRPNRLRQPDRS